MRDRTPLKISNEEAIERYRAQQKRQKIQAFYDFDLEEEYKVINALDNRKEQFYSFYLHYCISFCTKESCVLTSAHS